MKLGKAPRQARCYVTGNVIPTLLSACSDMGKRGRQLSAIKHWKQNQTLLHHSWNHLLHHSWNHLDLHNIKTECILIHHPAQSFLLLCFPWDQTDQHAQSWTSNKGQPWRRDWHESHTPWALTPLPPAPFPSQPQLGEFPQSRSHEGPVSARSTTQGLSWWWLSDTYPVPWGPRLAFCMFLPTAASMSQSLTSQKTAVRERPGFFPSRFLNCYRYRKWWEFSVSHSVTLETQLSLLLWVCVFQWFGEGAQGAHLQGLTTCRCSVWVFACFPVTEPSKTSPGRRPHCCFNTLPSYIPHRTVSPTDCRT